MIYDTIVEKILDELSEMWNIDRDTLFRCLELSNAKNKPNFTIFFIKMANEIKTFIDDLFTALINSKINGKMIKDCNKKASSITFNLNMKMYYKDILKDIFAKQDKYGSCDIGKGKTVIVEFSSPNIAKEFHMGHLRTTILGHFIKNLYNFCGYNALAFNYLGDWGMQFGSVLLAYEKYGKEEELQKEPIKHLLDLYVRITAEIKANPDLYKEAENIFKQMELDRNEKYLSQWKQFRELSIVRYKELYKKINIEFDVYEGESMYNEKAKELIMNSDIFPKNDSGPLKYNLKRNGEVVLMKRDGTSLYISRDMAAALERIKNYSPEKIVYVVSSEQNLYLRQLFELLECLGCDTNKFLHVNYGMISGMSTREGNVKYLEDIINISTDVMKKEIEKNEVKMQSIEDIEDTALNLAVSTLVIMDFSAKRIKGYEFDIEKRAKNVSGNGPYFQYAHCRLRSIEKNNASIDLSDFDSINFEYIESNEVYELVYKLLWFERVVYLCLDDFEPSRIVTYMQDLCSTINSIIDKHRVLNADIEVAKPRLFLLKCARVVLYNSLVLLGVKPLEKM